MEYKKRPLTFRLDSDTQVRMKERLGNIPTSKYIRGLIERDLSGHLSPPSPKSENALVELTDTFHPTLAPEIERWCVRQKVPQAKLIAHLLTLLADYIHRHEDDAGWNTFAFFKVSPQGIITSKNKKETGDDDLHPIIDQKK
jgi:hypothetical protein